MIKINLSEDFIEVQGVRVFNGFPYLMTDLTNGFYHIILLPSSWSKLTLHIFAHLQVWANQLDSYLMLNKNQFIRFSCRGPESIKDDWVNSPPAAELYFCGRLYPFGGRLYPAFEIPEDPDLISREVRLIRLVQAQLDSGRYVEIDGRALGGRKPNEEELKSLFGYYMDKLHDEIMPGWGDDYKIPLGTIKCEKCGWCKGHALYPDETRPEYVVPVHCKCENNNRCARCGERLYSFKLNSNCFYHFRVGIIHFSGYRALGHVCDDLKQKVQIENNDEKSNSQEEKDKNMTLATSYLELFETCSDEHLVQIYNGETMCYGWVSARGVFLKCLLKTFLSRRIDISQITNKSGGFLFGHHNFGVLFGKKVINMRYLVRDPEDPGVSCDPQVVLL